MADSPKAEINLPDKDIETLKHFIRLNKGLELPQKTSSKKRKIKESRPKCNSTSRLRAACNKKRKFYREKSEFSEENEYKRIQRLNHYKRKSLQFNLNKAFHIRWKNSRKLPIIASHYRKTFEDTGKLPFVVPAYYKPFDVYWDADWSKQEFIFLDEGSEDKKKQSTSIGTSTTEMTTTATTTTITPEIKVEKSDQIDEKMKK